MSSLRKSAGLLAMAALPAALAFAAPAHASLVLVGTFSGNQCTGGAITTCYANGTVAGSGTLTQVGANGAAVAGSPGILGLDNTGTTTGFTDSITVDGSGNHILNFNYTGAEVATYIGVFQGGSGLNCADCNNTYQLFYDAGGITSGTINLNTYFTNNGNISHVDLFDHGAVPEPATWAMMLIGFAGIGWSMRRARAGNLALS